PPGPLAASSPLPLRGACVPRPCRRHILRAPHAVHRVPPHPCERIPLQRCPRPAPAAGSPRLSTGGRLRAVVRGCCPTPSQSRLPIERRPAAVPRKEFCPGDTD